LESLKESIVKGIETWNASSRSGFPGVASKTSKALRRVEMVFDLTGDASGLKEG
jgi:hypothetical protein